MQIVVGEVFPLTNFLEPALGFPLVLSYNSLEIPLSLNGLLLAEDGKVLAQLTELNDVRGPRSIGGLGSQGTSKDNQLSKVSEHQASLVAHVSKGALDHLENVRDRNKKGDVVFKLNLKARILNSTCVTPPVQLKQFTDLALPVPAHLQQTAGQMMMYGSPRDYVPNAGNLWLISGTNGPVFLTVDDVQCEQQKTIHASDWVHDFAPQLGIGRFLIAEIPVPGSLHAEHEFADRLNKACEALQVMEEKIKEGEWGEVIEKSRPVAELLRQEDMIRSILVQHGHPEDAANCLIGGVKGLFEYSSKFIHKVQKDRKTLPPDIRAGKEDAYLAYTMSVGLVNLLTRKASKTEGA